MKRIRKILHQYIIHQGWKSQHSFATEMKKGKKEKN